MRIKCFGLPLLYLTRLRPLPGWMLQLVGVQGLAGKLTRDVIHSQVFLTLDNKKIFLAKICLENLEKLLKMKATRRGGSLSKPKWLRAHKCTPGCTNPLRRALSQLTYPRMGGLAESPPLGCSSLEIREGASAWSRLTRGARKF